MKVNEVMTQGVCTINPSTSLREAAKMMENMDIGSVIIAEKDKLTGVVTDRDIAIRAVAQNFSVDSPVSAVMSREVKYCFDDQEIEEVAKNMADLKVRRMPVVNRDKRLVGIISLGNISSSNQKEAISTMACGISARH